MQPTTVRFDEIRHFITRATVDDQEDEAQVISNVCLVVTRLVTTDCVSKVHLR